MLHIPISVLHYLIHFIIEHRSLAYLLVNKQACLSSWGGKLTAYGITNLKRGEDIRQQVFFLEGLLPLEDIPLFLPCMKTDDGIYADLHLFPSAEGDWVLLLDATWTEMQIKTIQQQVQDSNLLEEK